MESVTAFAVTDQRKRTSIARVEVVHEKLAAHIVFTIEFDQAVEYDHGVANILAALNQYLACLHV